MSSSFVSRLPEIIDQSARVAASVAGVTAVQGAGSGLVADPFRPGQTIQAWTVTPVPPPGLHVSMPPTRGTPEQGGLGMKGMTVLTWTIPMRFYWQRADLQNAVVLLAAIVPAYHLAFAAHITLFGTCRDAYLTDGREMGEGETSWWEWTLTAKERLDMPQSA